MTPEPQNARRQSAGEANRRPFGQVSFVMFIGLGLLAVLSVVEFAFPKLKWFTFPAMVVGLAFVAAVHFFHRGQAWVATVRWLRWLVERDKSKPTDGDSPKPITPE